MITGYETDVDPLQPGSIFDLKIDVTNLGKADAKAVTMVLGGGVSPGDQSGTPQAGGVSGSSGDLTNFAPMGSSNLVFIGDIKQGETISTSGTFVTNVSTQPGVYTLKVSYLYSDAKGNRIVDDQVITLLVFSLPQVEISFYRGGLRIVLEKGRIQAVEDLQSSPDQWDQVDACFPALTFLQLV